MAAAMHAVNRRLPNAAVSQLFRVPRLTRHVFHNASRNSSSMTSILTKNAAPPVGPFYSQAIRTDHAIYVSGQLPMLADGTMVASSTGDKTEAIIRALEAILVEAGSGLEKIVKAQVFLTDMKDYPEMNEVYAKMITHSPARSCIAVKELPKGSNVEIECIALP